MSVFRVGNSQRGRRRVPVAPVDGSSDTNDVETKPEHGVWLVKLDILREYRTFFSRDAHTKVHIVREVRLVR